MVSVPRLALFRLNPTPLPHQMPRFPVLLVLIHSPHRATGMEIERTTLPDSVNGDHVPHILRNYVDDYHINFFCGVHLETTIFIAARADAVAISPRLVTGTSLAPATAAVQNSR